MPASVPSWADCVDVRTIAGMIRTANAMTAALDTIAARGGDFRTIHTVGGQLGTVRVRREMAYAARQWQPVQEPTDGDTVVGALWDELDGARSAWIKARLADDGLADVWTRQGATDAECMMAHDRERELEAEAPSVADVVTGATAFVGGLN